MAATKSGKRGSSRWDDVLYEIAFDLGCDLEYEVFARQVDIDEEFTTLPRLERWRGFVESHCGHELGDVEYPTADVDGDVIEEGLATLTPVEIDCDPAGRSSEQASLDLTSSK